MPTRAVRRRTVTARMTPSPDTSRPSTSRPSTSRPSTSRSSTSRQYLRQVRRQRLGRTALVGLAAGAVAVTATLTVALDSSAEERSADALTTTSSAAAGSVRALADVPPRPTVVRSTPTRASRGAARTAAPRTKLVWRTVAVGRTFSGEASWYGPGFQGRRTANGERYDMYAMTAAHRSLPFGTRLRVCRGERCVVVRINDRGPFVGGRVLDLSKAAAQQLGYSGTAHVTATPVRATRVRVAT